MDDVCYYSISPLNAEIEILRPVATIARVGEAGQREYVERVGESEERTDQSGAVGRACPETRLLNLERGLGLVRRYRREEGLTAEPADLNPTLFVVWLLGIRPSVQRATWRNYRAQALIVVEAWPDDQHRERAMAMLTTRDGSRTRGKPRRITRVQFDRLRADLKRRRGAKGNVLDDLLVGSISTGLMPHEWSMAKLVRRPGDNKLSKCATTLIVSDVTRINGYRSLKLSQFSEEGLAAVERTILVCERWKASGKLGQNMAELSRIFRQTCDVLFPALRVRLSLQAIRHQFIANARSKYSDAEVDALLGSFPTEDGISLYKNRCAAWSREDLPDVPEPSENEVAVFVEFFERNRLRTLARDARSSDRLA